MKKLILCGLAALALTSCSNSGTEPFENVDLIPVKLSGSTNWSMVDADGNIVYEDEFKEPPTASVNGVFTVKENDGYTLYRNGGKSPEIFGKCEGLKNAGVMADGRIPVTFPEERITVMDDSGEKKFTLDPYSGQEITACFPAYTDGLLGVQLADGKGGYVDTDGKMVIKPEYDRLSAFREGLAVVGKKTDDGNVKYSVIDKSGEVQFKLKDSYGVDDLQYHFGYLLVNNDSRYIMLDKKGEVTKLPAKVKGVYGYNAKYIIFSDGDDKGVMNFEGEILVRAKYSSVEFLDEDLFLAHKSNDDETEIVNATGETVAKLDYKRVYNLYKFGLLARDGGSYVLVDREGKSTCKEEFSDINLAESSSAYVESDFFDANSIVTAMMQPAEEFLKNHPFGTSAEDVNGGRQPSYMDCNYSIDMDRVSGTGYSISMAQVYNTQAAAYAYGMGEYEWDPSAELSGLRINVSTDKEWGKRGNEAIAKYLTSKKFKAGPTLEEYGALKTTYTSDDCRIEVSCSEKSCSVDIFPAAGTVVEEVVEEEVEEEVQVEEVEVAEAPAAGSDYRSMVCNRRLTAADLQGKSKKELRLMRNTIYAVHGRKFRSADLDNYFRQFSWYKPVGYDIPAASLSATEMANAALIAKYEK